MREAERVTCPSCKGRGEVRQRLIVVAYRQCIFCKGAGKMSEAERETYAARFPKQAQSGD